MDIRKTGQATGMVGIVFVVLLVGSLITAPNPPQPDSPYRDILSYYADHHTSLLVSGVLGLLLTPFFILFLGGLRARLARDEEPGAPLASATLAGGVLLASMGAMAEIINAAITQRIAALGEERTLRAAFELNGLSFSAISAATAAFIIPAALAGLRGSTFPSWTSWLGLIVGVLSIIGACANIYKDTSPLAFLAFAGLSGFVIWVLVVAMVLLRDPDDVPGVPSEQA